MKPFLVTGIVYLLCGLLKIGADLREPACNRPAYTRSIPAILMVALLWPWAAFRQWSADLRSHRHRGRALLWLVLGPALVGVLYLAVEAGLGMW
jgi:hypothetical protein